MKKIDRNIAYDYSGFSEDDKCSVDRIELDQLENTVEELAGMVTGLITEECSRCPGGDCFNCDIRTYKEYLETPLGKPLGEIKEERG